MRIENFKSRMANRDMMAGTFLKTPAYELVEVLATSELDFICIDMEHSPFDRARTDACLAVARALDFPVLVRVTHFAPQTVLQVLDMGAVGVVAPHIITAEQAKDLVRAAAVSLAPRVGPDMAGKIWRKCWRNRHVKLL
jgi:2-keto-3-deoxy-L-rhamnonate aldolase RhmA